MPLYRETKSSLEDWESIAKYTLNEYGTAQTKRYMQSLKNGMEDMAKGILPFRDIKRRGITIRVKHCEKHYIFAALKENEPMEILAILHERMDLMKRIEKRLNP